MIAHRFHLWLSVLSLATLIGCIPDGKLKIDFNWEPADIGDGWEVSSPQDAGFSQQALRRAYEVFFSEDQYPTAISLLVVRHGYLIAEGYCRTLEDRFIPEAIQSATKSYTAMVFGIALAEGYFASLDARLFDSIPEAFDADPRKRDITLRHLLTMTSGIAFDNDDFAMEMAVEEPADTMRFILSRSLYDSPGERFYYRDADPHLLSGAIQAVTGQTIEEIAQRHLFEPMGITEWKWEEDSAGISFGPYGLYARPRDLAKFGQLVLDGGAWNGNQLIPSDWVTAATSFQVDPDPQDQSPQGFGYGFYWWTVPELDAFTAWGHGGNFIFIVPEQDLVIVFTAEPDTNGDTVATTLEEFVPLARAIIDAVEQ